MLPTVLGNSAAEQSDESAIPGCAGNCGRRLPCSFDEATSAFDPALVSKVLSVMRDLAAEGMTMMIFAAHELRVVTHVADKIMFMDSERIIEHSTQENLFRSAKPETACPIPVDLAPADRTQADDERYVDLRRTQLE